MPKTVHLTLPLSEADIRALALDDIVYLTGDAYTMMYLDHFSRLAGMIKAGEPLPMELAGNAIYNTGTIFRKREDGSYDLRAIGTTTSSKFNGPTPEFIRLSGVRAVIGKGGMDRAVLAAMKECGCVYLAAVGGCSAIYTPGAAVVEEYWPQHSWADTQLKLRLTNFGPLYVGMDAHGNSLYEDCAGQAARHLPAIYQALGISTDGIA